MTTDTPVQPLVILFADVAGSTQLYSSIGDIPAEKQISQCLSFMANAVRRFKGTLIKSIGDELLCSFTSVSNAIQACCEIQQLLSESSALNNGKLNVRMGLHFGPVLMKDNDVFGDTVNLAARMVGLAQAKQIICTQEVIEKIPPQLGMTIRNLQPCYVKGKADPVNVFEVIWSQDTSELTCFVAAKTLPTQQSCSLSLSFNGHVIIINASNPEITLGRGSHCGVVVACPQASREHAKIAFRRDKVVLIDQSTNGTFVQNDTDDEVFLNKEELPLLDKGIISLGIPAAENTAYLIRFRYQ
ncbi:MAG TPA: adenylate/guanylate cyclase domain-containing protein [Pseudomonadales bacterium]|nr:adenylate/guanylate cyclase domain-containing protein [Pseudomonadales bacterium]